MRYETVGISIAGFNMGLDFDVSPEKVIWPHAFQDFFTDSDPDIHIHVRYKPLPKIRFETGQTIFDSRNAWTFHRLPQFDAVRKRDLLALILRSGRIAIFKNQSGFMSVARRMTDKLPGNSLFRVKQPLDHGFGPLLMVLLAAKNYGLMLHACGINDSGKGYLFCGNSTHGKSTCARLWAKTARVLNDDRIIVKFVNDRFWIYGTPWHGDVDVVSSERVPLDKVFFLHKGSANKLSEVAGATACSMLLSRSFPPIWDDAGMRFTLEFISRMEQSVPFYNLQFTPDDRLTDFIRCMK